MPFFVAQTELPVAVALCHFCAIFYRKHTFRNGTNGIFLKENLNCQNAEKASNYKENPALQGAGNLAQRVGFENTRKIRFPLCRNGLKTIPVF